MQIRPHPSIASIVKHYLLLQGNLEQEAVLRLFADGNTGLVFNLNDTAIRTASASTSLHQSWIYGQLSRYQDIVLHGPFNWVIVVLHPYAAYRLWGEAIHEWKNLFIGAQEAIGPDVDRIYAQLLKAPSIHHTTTLLDAWIMDMLRHNHAPDNLLQHAIQLINAAEGTQPVHVLLKQLGVNERMLERKFKAGLGISPKQYSGVIRITASAKKIRHLERSGGLTGIAYDNDYFDQAHFIKDFKRYTGITPLQFRHNPSPLALNVLRF